MNRATRRSLSRDPLQGAALRDLRLWAELVGDRDAAFVALLSLSALGLADQEERRLCDAAIRRAFPARLTSSAALTSKELAPLLTPALDPRYESLLRNLFAAAIWSGGSRSRSPATSSSVSWARAAWAWCRWPCARRTTSPSP